jgi:RNA polymerase primary sigma factor
MKSLQIKRSITDRSDTSLASYLKDISRIPMLSAEEELEIAKKAKEGDKKIIG